MGLSELEDLRQRYSRLEELYSETVKERDLAIEERDKATVLIALQLESETEELNKRIEKLQIQNRKLDEENEDLKIRLGYAKDDLNKLQQRHIKLQIEQERCLQEKEDVLAKLREFDNFSDKRQIAEVIGEGEAKMASGEEDPAYFHVRDEIFAPGTEEDLELQPKPPVTPKKSSLEDVYDVHEEIGKGKFGVVKKVTERSSKTTFAAKHIRLSSAGSGSSRDDIMREIDVMNKLHHKRLVGLVDAFDMSRNIVMIMEFVSGGELFERVADADCLTEREASFYMYQLLQGLQYMHTKNIVHLDLKPENIVCVSKDSWDIKLIDFGLAQELLPGVRMTALKGTPEFMAPEAVNFEPISLATDMWSVGVIAYILLSGLSPFLGEDNNETLANVTAVEWDFEDESFDVISDEAKNFIAQLLVKSNRKRNTVKQSLEHEWMKKSASADAVKIDTKKLKQFLAKRRWQIPFLSESASHSKMLTEDEILEKSVNALKAVRRLSTLSSLMNTKNRPSIAPSLPTLPSAKEDVEDTTGNYGIREEKGEDEAGETTNKENVSKEEAHEERPKEPPVFNKELGDISITEGKTASFEVVIENNTNCQIHWLKNGVELIENQRLKVESHDHGRYLLLIGDIADHDSGEYSCVAENEAGTAISTGTISIQPSSVSKSDETDEDEEEEIDSSIEIPVFKKELHDITASEQDTVTLEVIVGGDSPYELEWFKNAVEITENVRISVVKHEDGRFTLNIRECEDDDTGEYCCVAQNEAGRVTCVGWLTVEVESVLSEDDEETESEDEDEFVPKEFVTIKNGDVQKFYCIEEEVGRGRFGIVKKCVELDTATRFCAKLIKSRPSQKEEFKREIDVVNALHHPRIIRLYDAFEEPRRIILILEYCRGGDLFNRIDGDSLPEFEAVKVLKQVLEAVKYMHDLGFMHLDLKPQNVMFKNEGGSKIKLIDFSLTKKFDPEQETKISFGTAEYVAPEIVSYEPVTLAADMWAIGVIAYIMLSGESPFLCESEADTFSRITDARWEFTDVFDYVSKEAKDFIKRLLLKDPRKRMTVAECLEHEWIKSPGFTGKRKSKLSSEGELTIDQNSNVTSPTELMRQESGKSEQELPLDPRKLESKVKSLLSKLQNAEKENQELEEKLRDEEDRADVLEDELHTNENFRKVLEDRVSKLEAEKTDLSKKAKANSDVLKRVAQSEGDKRALEDKLSEQTRYLETLSQKYDTLKEKIENYDILEEKAYLLERERKDLRDAKQSLEDKIGHLQAEKEELKKMNEKNSLINRDLDNEIAKLKTDRNEIENQYVRLRTEKESLVEELTKRFNILDEQKRSLGQEKSNLETKLRAFESENKNLKLKLDGLTKEMESLKEVSKNNEQDKEKNELETELTKVKMHNDEAKKTCEELASKLSKAYAELEQLKPTKMDSASEYREERATEEKEANSLKWPKNHQEEISALTERLSSLEEERDNLEDDLDEREAEIVELKEKIEHLEAENKDRGKDIINYKSQLEAANEEIKSWRMRKDGTSSAAPKGDEESLNEKIKDYEYMMSKLTKEISVLQEKLSAADQLNKKLEEKVKSSTQASLPDPNMVSEIIGRSENTLEYSSMDFDYLDGLSGDRNDRNEEISVKGRINDDLNKEGESERFVMLKREFEKVRRMSEDAETRLAEEIQKNQTLEDELEDFEIKEENGLRMYRELEKECNRLRAQLTDSESCQNQVEVRLREKLQSNEEGTEALCKQVDSLKKQLHVIKEERDKGDTLYTNLSEKYRNLLKEKKILEQEKHEREETETKSRELEDSLQTRILELTSMKDEIKSMRDNLRSLVREKEESMKEFSLLQKDLGKATNDRQQLAEQVKDEIFRAEKLERDRFMLQSKIEEMQNNLHKRDLVAAANKKMIDAYVDEIRLLKDEKGDAFKEVDKLRKQSKNLMHDLEKITKEREDVESLKIFKEQAMKEIKSLKDENQRLLQKCEDFDQITVDLNTLREEKAIGLQHLGILEEESENASREIAVLESENELLLEKTNQLEEIKQAFESLKDDADILRENIEALKLEKKASEKEIEDLRKENNLHLEKAVEYDKMKEDLETLREEKVIGLKELSSLRERNASLLEEVKATDELKKECDFLKSKKEKALEENRILTELNESLVKDQEGNQRISLELKKAEDEAERISKENGVLAEKCKTLKGKIKELTLLKDGQLIELRRLNQELDDSKKENEALVAELESFHVIKKDFNASLKSNQRLQKESRDLQVNLETQTLEAMRLKKETTVLKKRNDALTKEVERLQGKNAILETQASIVFVEEGEESEQIYEPKTSDTKGVRRKLDEFTTFEEIASDYSVEEEKPENVKPSKVNKRNEAQALKEEVNFLQKEVEDLSEDHKDLLQSYNALQKDYDYLKEKFGVLEKSLEIKSREMKSMTEVRDLLENTKIELENELKVTSQEKTQVSKELETVKENCDSQRLRLEIAEKEIGNLSKENEELHQNHIELEERYGRIRKLNRELEEDIDIETGKLFEARERISELKKENTLLQQRNLMLLHEIDKLKGIPELSSQEQGGVAKKVKNLEKKISVAQMQKGDLEIRPPEEKNKGKNAAEKNKTKVSGGEARKPEGCAENVKEEKKVQQNQEERTVWALEREIKNLRPQKERAEALAKELDQVKQKLDNEIKMRKSKTEESSQKKKENDLLIYELESTRHRIVSNVISLLEEAKLPWKFSVTAADISAGKSKAWFSIKESIGTLIWERERMVNENAILQQENSKLKRECQEPRKGKEKIKQFEELVSKKPTDEDILSKQQEIKALHETIASDKDNLTQLQQQQKDLLLKIEFMQRMQSTADQERDQLVASKSLFTSDRRPGLNTQSRFKLRRFQSVESISILKEGDIFEEKQDPVNFPTQTRTITTQWSGNRRRESSTGEEQLQVAREMVKKNRRIFELEQEVDVLLTKIEESSTGNAAGEKFSSDAENFRMEILRLEGENKRLKELANEPILASWQKKMESLEAINNFLKSEKEELILEISAKNKKIELLEKRVRELTEMKSNVVNGSRNGVHDEADLQINALDEELSKTKHKVSELEAELEHLSNSHNSKLKRELDEVEAKWTKRLRKECMELHSELSEKHNKEKQLWQKKEVELQNIIRQMKIVMDKRLSQAETERKKLEQELINVKTSSLHGSTISLDSNSDDSAGGVSPKPGKGNDTAQSDGLSDRELRRVAYKLNGEEWSQLGTFLGVGDKDLGQLSGLSMGPQEKAFKLLVMWRTRCCLSRARMISHLAVALEEVNRKDVAQFVLEQFMSGKPRKKLFGW